MKKFLKWTVYLISICVIFLIILVTHFSFRPNRSEVSEVLKMETWPAVHDGLHNSNTDMIFYDGSFYLIHAAAPYHFASETTRLVLLKSQDAREWEKIAEFQNPGEDIRDPKLAVIDDKLFIYALKNVDFAAEPYGTVVTTSTDGVNWEPFQDIEPKGWLFWRPKSNDGGKTWYIPAYWNKHGKSILLRSTDGLEWEEVSQIYKGDVNDETAIEFLKDGRMLTTARLEVAGYYFGDNRGNTLIAVSEPPHTEWTEEHSFVTRLDGPYLFTVNDRVYAVGRLHTGWNMPLTETGSILGKKRTSIFLVDEKGLTHLSDFPSAGDTSYPGVVIVDDHIYICYYTSNIKRDYPWVIGMFAPSDIMMAKISVKSLEELADLKLK
jgi:hypothetical protein